MKKVLILIASAVLTLSAVSCRSVEDKAKDYAERLKVLASEGRAAEAEELTKEAAAWYESLSDADKDRVDALDIE